MAKKTAKTIINKVALEVGIPQATSPYSSGDAGIIQLRGLLQSAGEELIEAYNFQELRREHTFTTTAQDDNIFDLPDGFERMIDQTGWQRTDKVPLLGPVTPQQWQYLEGRDLASSTIYASFRLTQGKLYLYPTDPPDGIEIAYEFISNLWVEDSTSPGTFINEAMADADTPQFNSRMVERLLKALFLEARGFDSTAARAAYATSFEQVSGQEESAPVLNAGGGNANIDPYLSTWRNTPDSGYG